MAKKEKPIYSPEELKQRKKFVIKVMIIFGIFAVIFITAGILFQYFYLNNI